MEIFIDILIAILIFGAIAMLFYLSVTFKTKKEKEYEERLKKSLADEYIIDPDTGAKLTLEQAESGHWLAHDNEFRTISESELNNLPTDDEIIVQKALNYLRESKTYRKIILNKNELKKFEKTKILRRYDDWSYSNPFKFENGILILPEPKLRSMTSYLSDYCESHVMVWIKINNINGHYYLREKSYSEKFFDKIRNDDDLKITDYECFTFIKSHFVIQINQILKNFQNERRLEIEIDNDNLFIKTDRLVNLEDILRIEKIIKQLTKPSLNINNSKNIK